MAKRRIGILTGGGDVPGLNAVIKSVTYRGSERARNYAHATTGGEHNEQQPRSARRVVSLLPSGHLAVADGKMRVEGGVGE